MIGESYRYCATVLQYCASFLSFPCLFSHSRTASGSMIVPLLVRLLTRIKMNSVYVVYILCRSKHENNSDNRKRSNRRLIERILERNRKQAGNRSKRLDVYGKKKLEGGRRPTGKKNQKCGDFNDNTLEAEKKCILRLAQVRGREDEATSCDLTQKVPYSDSSSAIDCKMLAVSASSTACSCMTFRPWTTT
jgi:hypothetical protein